jgi:hypothetical protein
MGHLSIATAYHLLSRAPAPGFTKHAYSWQNYEHL